MPGIEDLTNIMMAGGRPDVPMPPPPQGPPMGGPPPEMMADQMPMEEQAPEMSIEQDSMALAEAVVGRAQGDIQMAVTILDTAKDMLMQSAEQPQMMYMGGDIRPGRPTPPPPPPRVNPSMSGAGMARRANQARRLGSRGPGGWNMGGPLYAAKGRALSDSDIDDTEVLKQMLMDELTVNGQEGRTLSDKDEKRFRDYQPEGLLKGTIFDYVPDPYQISNWLSDKFGYPGIDTKGAGRAESDRDRTISDRISEEEVRNEIRMLEREEPSSQRDMTYDEALEYLQQTRQRSK